ncbi:hypothetical protein PVAND_013811 [Polypedilum vanderplanki]|uniref:Uncharacterized protein n=1 Tax=Polypedilum vanderplanki TaxID=319348 RepID=A0A9J6CQI2_POLVA|nr:hypothetical protein PVAND_013811 [Polypedilum vanderplanki]
MLSLRTLKYSWSEFISHFQINSNPLKPLEIILSISKLLGLWITKVSSWKYIFFGLNIGVLFIIPNIALQLSLTRQIKNVAELTAFLGVFITFISVLFEIFMFYYHIKKIKNLIEKIKSCIQDFKVNEILLKRAIEMNNILKLMIFSTEAILLMSLIAAILNHNPSNQKTVTLSVYMLIACHGK